MRKLKLDLDSLTVESFAAKEQPTPRGTVYARTDAASKCWPYPCWDTANSACGTYGTACPPYCGTGGDSVERTCPCQSMNPAQTECHDCEI